VLKIIEDFSSQEAFKKIKFLNVAIEEIPDLAQKLDISAVPVVICFKNQKAVHRIDGVNIADLTNAIKTIAEIQSTPNEANSLEDRLKLLINKAKVMVFMKGDR
jgi:thioredoxin-like negative regulator of GroEL